eukprot:4150711-Amphidinium_carterae.1
MTCDGMDVQAEDPAVRVRYNAAKMEQHQFRQLCCNLYDGVSYPSGALVQNIRSPLPVSFMPTLSQ